MPVQKNLFGETVVTGDIRDRIIFLLEEYPETRDDYHELMVRYWLEFDGLDRLLPDETAREAFREWFVKRATTVKTIQNRALEIQRRYSALDARPSVRKLRDNQAKAGPVIPR